MCWPKERASASNAKTLSALEGRATHQATCSGKSPNATPSCFPQMIGTLRPEGQSTRQLKRRVARQFFAEYTRAGCCRSAVLCDGLQEAEDVV
jgi:hypothetical protein